MAYPSDIPDRGGAGSQEERPTASVPPPPRSNSAIPGTGAAYAPAGPAGGSATRRAPTVEEAEALARVAALAVSDKGGGPSRALVATMVALGVLVVALLLLALIVSVGPDPSTTP